MHLTKRYNRVLAYIRVSGEGQFRDGTSPEGQEESHRRFCAAHGLPEPIFFTEVESATEAKIEARVEQLRLQQLAQPGDLVIVTLVDRWSRDTPHGVKTVRDLVRRGVGWIAHEEEVDASTDRGDEELAQRVVDAERERRRIYRRTIGRRNELKAQGLYVEGQVPLGYRREVTRIHGRRVKRLAVDAEGAEVFRAIKAMALRGASLREMAERAPTVPGARRKKWDPHSIHQLLCHRVYLGEVRVSGPHRGQPGAARAAEWIKGQHEPLMTREEWDAIQAGFAARKLGGAKPKDEARTSSWLLRGLVTCALCGKKMSAAYRKGRGAGGYLDYFACRGRLEKKTCAAPFIRVDLAEPAVEHLVLERLVDLRYELAAARPVRVEAPAANFEAQRRTLLDRRARTVDLHVDGTITKIELTERLAKIDTELGRIESAILARERAARAREAARSPEHRAKLSDELAAVSQTWGAMPRHIQRELVKRLVSAIALARGQAPRIIWRSIDELLSERA